MATKFSAFHTRGCDPRTSHDFEDIVYLMDNRLNLVNDILNTDSQVKDFLVNEFNKFLTQKVLQEALLAHLEPGSQKKRYEMLMTKISRIVFKNIV
jgi:hypothetical protein